MYFIKDAIYHQVASVAHETFLQKGGSCNPMLFLSADMHCIHMKST